jgi:hypothetical protein
MKEEAKPDPAIHAGRVPRTSGSEVIRGRMAVGLTYFVLQGLMLAALLYGGARTADAFLAVTLLAVLTFLTFTARAARMGRLTRESAAELAVASLTSILMGGVIWAGTVLGGASLALANLSWIFLVLLVGEFVCLLLGGRRKLAVGVLAWSVGVTLFLNPLGLTRHSTGDLRRQLASFDLDVSELTRWEQAGMLHRALTVAGAETPDMGDVAARVKDAIRSGAKVHPRVWTVSSQMGLLEPSDWQGLALRKSEAYKLDQLRGGINGVLEGKEPRGLSRTTYQQYVLPMLLANQEVDGDLTEEALEALAQTVLSLWPETGDHSALEQASACVGLLDLLGRDDLVNELRPSARQLLVDHWVSGRDLALYGKAGGFTPQPAKFKTSMDGATWDGVDLMARFGAPDSIDLDLLRGHLLHESQGFGTLGDLHAYLKAKSRGALLRLETEFEFPTRSPWERLLGQRLLLGVLLLVVVCVVTAARQPSGAGRRVPR